ncbi:MAG TPA: gas vesicle protein [Streptosporangiaceae bacterium]
MTDGTMTSASTAERMPQRQIALVDLLDRVLAGGVVIAGDVTLSIAGVDLVQISLRTIIMSVRAGMSPADPSDPGIQEGDEV